MSRGISRRIGGAVAIVRRLVKFTEHEPVSHPGFIPGGLETLADASATGANDLAVASFKRARIHNMRAAHFLAVAAVAASMSFAAVSEGQAQGLSCRPEMMHLMSTHACSQRRGCLRTHLQYLSKGCLAKLSFRTKQRLRAKHVMS